ncbi:integrase, catalytic region, zinc finger, CCHC-type containing protein [Tanacetum coccineum]
MTYQQKNKLFSDLKNYFWEEPHLFKVYPDGMIRRCVSRPETQTILDQCHYGPIGGHYGPTTTAKKVLDSGFYWPTIIKEVQTLVRLYDTCQKSRNISKRDEMPLNSIQFLISSEETIDSGFTRFNAIVTSLKSLDQDYSSKNHVRKFLRALPLKWRAKVTAVEEAKDLSTLPLDELIGNLKVYEMILENDGVASKTTKEKVKPLALKAKVTREQTSDDSDSQGGSNEDVDEEESKAFNLIAKNFRNFFCKNNRFGSGNRFVNGANRFRRGRGNSFGNKGGKSSRQKRGCYNYGEGHFIGECPKPKENKAFVRGAWSNSEDGNEPQNNATCCMEINSQEVLSKPSSSYNDLEIIHLQKENEELIINELELEVKKLAKSKEVAEPCKKCDVLTQEVDSLKCSVSRLQDKALDFSKFKKSSVVLDDMLIPSASALQVLRRLGSIFTSVYSAKVYKVGKRLLYVKRNKAISLGKGASKVGIEVQQLSLKDCTEVVVQSESEGSDDEDISDLKKITPLLAKAFNRKKYYGKTTNNNLRTSLASHSANKKQEYVKSEEKKEDKKADEKKRDMSKVKCYNCKKEGYFSKDCKKAKVKDYNYYKTKMLLAKKDSDEQVLLAEDQAWMESSSDSVQEINANMVFMAKMENVLSDSEENSSSVEETIAEVSYYTSDSESESEYETSEYYDNYTNYDLFVDNDDDQEIFHDAIEFASENFNENHIVSQTDHDQLEVDHNDSEDKDHLVDKLIKKFNQRLLNVKNVLRKRINKAKI